MYVSSDYYIINYCKYLLIMGNNDVLQMTLKLCFMRLILILARMLGKVLAFLPPQMFIDR